MAHPIATQSQPGFSPRPPISEDEVPAELDEPPDESLHFTRATPLKTSATPIGQCTVSSLAQHDKKASLLTQALLTSDESTPNSDTEAPLLTSDVDLTSPTGTNSPSPPLQPSSSRGLATMLSQDRQASDAQNLPDHDNLHRATETMDSATMTDLEAGLGRKRCIKFACGRQDIVRPEGSQVAKPPITKASDTKANAPTKRPCMLRFVCPNRASVRSTTDRPLSANLLNNDSIERSSSAYRQNLVIDSATRQHRDSVSTIKAVPMAMQEIAKNPISTPKSSTSRNPNTEGSEASRFHEFAGPYSTEDEWVHEQPTSCKKITVNDTLRKENAIRKLGEEVEEEALEEEDDAEEQDEDFYAELEELHDDLSSDYSVSDDGNETDDEEGFAESDNESELGSDYQFWTPGLTTAATSADHLEHIRPNAPRTASDSSIGSMIRVNDAPKSTEPAGRRVRKTQGTQPVKMRPGTPDLPDSTDFVCGTLDEDRPLEAAYMSCLDERRRSKRCVIPQDIDPSFPTSEPEDDQDGDTSDESKPTSDEPPWVMGQPDHSDEERTNTRHRPLTRRKTKSPMPSPKRLRSPPPQKRSMVHRSPPPVAHRAAANGPDASMPPSPTDDKPWPPSQRITPNFHGRTKLAELATGDLPRRPQLTHTASLPRTPNPFWAPHRVGYPWSSAAASPKGREADGCSRGPIDIVTGLEKKRQRRKEKYWRQHCRNGVKEKERRCQPGKGALRMRELGLEMAGKSKGYLPHAQMMLSV